MHKQKGKGKGKEPQKRAKPPSASSPPAASSAKKARSPPAGNGVKMTLPDDASPTLAVSGVHRHHDARDGCASVTVRKQRA